jgi:polyhydroxyalkanoate synthesis regulator phasin
MPEPTDMIMPMLREMRDETRQGFDDMRSRLDGLDERLRAVERLVKVQREAFEGESILGRYAAKEVEERLSALERKVEALESRE